MPSTAWCHTSTRLVTMPSRFDDLETLLHAQVAIIADKHECVFLCRLAETSFVNMVMAVNRDAWAVFVYDYTTTVALDHAEI
jgi:hypothetical protein